MNIQERREGYLQLYTLSPLSRSLHSDFSVDMQNKNGLITAPWLISFKTSNILEYIRSAQRLKEYDPCSPRIDYKKCMDM